MIDNVVNMIEGIKNKVIHFIAILHSFVIILGLYEECVASLYEYMDNCNVSLHEVVDEWSTKEKLVQL